MKYIVIGLGNYGTVLAVELAALGHEVIGVDVSGDRVDEIKDKVATAFVIDATDETSLSVLPLNNVDAVIVAISEDFGASIRVTAKLKQHNVKHIYARAMDDVHKAVLQAFDIDQILTPEEDAAYSLVAQLDFGTGMDIFHVDKAYWVAKFKVPAKFIGHSVGELNLEEEFNLKVITLTRSGQAVNFLGLTVKEQSVLTESPVDSKIAVGDELVCFGKKTDFQKLWKAM